MHAQRILLGLSLAVSGGGCTNLEVYLQKQGTPPDKPEYTQLKGIPFYSKIPVTTQETKRIAQEVAVQVTLVDESATPHVTTYYPATGPLRLKDSAETRASLDDEVPRLLQNLTGGGAREASGRIATFFGSLSKFKPTVGETIVASNSWTVSTVLSPNPHFITNRQPLFGTASANFEFSPDQTLTKASSETTDDTAKTLLGLFPITAKLTQRWGLPAPAVAGAPRPTFKVDVTITQVKTTYVLRKVSHLSDAGDYLEANRPPLSLHDARSGIGGVQLISVDEQVSGGGGDKKDDSESAYRLEGRVIIPKEKPAKPAPGGGAGGLIDR